MTKTKVRIPQCTPRTAWNKIQRRMDRCMDHALKLSEALRLGLRKPKPTPEEDRQRNIERLAPDRNRNRNIKALYQWTKNGNVFMGLVHDEVSA